MNIYTVAGLCFLGDLILLSCLLAERHGHVKSRRAVSFWRGAAREAAIRLQALGVHTNIHTTAAGREPDPVELDMIKAREEIRRRADARRRGEPYPATEPRSAA